MLTFIIPTTEVYDNVLEEFRVIRECEVYLEHSLFSLALWESKWKIPFLRNKKITIDQLRDYVNCMCLNKIDPINFQNLTNDNIETITKYMDDSMTATTFAKSTSGNSTEIITAEKLYYRMIINNIPMEVQYWHLNRLLTLLRVFDIKNAPQQKMGKAELAVRNAQLNAERRSKLNTKG